MARGHEGKPLARGARWLAGAGALVVSGATCLAAAQPAPPKQPAPAKASPAAAPPPAPSAEPAASAPPDSSAPPPPRPDPATVLPPRPPTSPYVPPAGVPWERHLEIGPDLAFVTMPASHDAKGQSTGVHYSSTFGFAAHATWQMLKNLQFSIYFTDSNHGLRFNPGALNLPGQIWSTPVHTYSFGARFQPLIPIGQIARAWISAGIGWERWDFPRMEVTNGPLVCAAERYYAHGCYVLYERANNMAVFPFGLGASLDVIPHHLALTVEFSAGIPAFQSGTAIDPTRAVDDEGKNRPVQGLPLIDVVLVETLGFSLVL